MARLKVTAFSIVAVAALVFGFAIACFDVAVADEASGGAAATVVEEVDYTQVLAEISGKIDGLAKSADSAAIAAGVDGLRGDFLSMSAAFEDLANDDSSENVEKVNALISGLTGVQVFMLVADLITLGVVLAMVFLVSYRSHT